MELNREELLKELQSVASGLSSREVVEQSTCFVFQNGIISTYNDEVTCCRKTLLNEINGAVRSDPLLDILSKLPDKTIKIRFEEKNGTNRLIILGKRRRVTLAMDAEIHLPIESVKLPKKWFALSNKFIEAIQMAKGCTADESSDFGLSCIHCAPEFIEACDRLQAARIKVNIGLKQSVLIRKESINHIIPLAVIKWGLTKTWIHFRNKDGLTISCRRYSADEYRNLDSIYDNLKGSRIRLSDGLLDVGSRANILSKQNPEGNYLTVQIEQGKIKISSSSISGKYTEFATLRGYNGKGTKFCIPPDTLKYIIKEHKTVLIESKRIIAKGPNFIYVASITPAEGQ